MRGAVLQARMEKLARAIITLLAKEGCTPATVTWEEYRNRFFRHFWGSGYSSAYLTRLSHYGAEDFALQHYLAERGPHDGRST